MVVAFAPLKAVTARKFLGKLRYVFASAGPGGKVGSIRDDAVGFPNCLMRKVPGVVRFGPAGKVRCLIHGVQQEERAALATVSELAQRACRRAHLVCFKQQNRAGEQVPSRVFECVCPHLLLELMRQGKKAALVFQAGEGKQYGAGGPGGSR